jgi:hypothetical protein
MSSSKSRAASTAIIDTGIFEHLHRPMSGPQAFTDRHTETESFLEQQATMTKPVPFRVLRLRRWVFLKLPVFFFESLAFYYFRFFSSKLFSTSEQTIWSMID